ncbi:MAG: EVE domain-containing protein [Nitrospiraceae bacterium]
MSTGRQYWLMKTEPSSFSIEDLKQAPQQQTCWDGVRNFQARNYLRRMKIGDQVLFYHSSADPPSVVGVVEVIRTAYPDPTQFDKQDHHYDAGSDPADPRWDMVDIKLKRAFLYPLPLESLRAQSQLKSMELLRKGSRLSVQPVQAAEWGVILGLAAKQKG